MEAFYRDCAVWLGAGVGSVGVERLDQLAAGVVGVAGGAAVFIDGVLLLAEGGCETNETVCRFSRKFIFLL